MFALDGFPEDTAPPPPMRQQPSSMSLAPYPQQQYHQQQQPHQEQQQYHQQGKTYQGYPNGFVQQQSFISEPDGGQPQQQYHGYPPNNFVQQQSFMSEEDGQPQQEQQYHQQEQQYQGYPPHTFAQQQQSFVSEDGQPQKDQQFQGYPPNDFVQQQSFASVDGQPQQDQQYQGYPPNDFVQQQSFPSGEDGFGLEMGDGLGVDMGTDTSMYPNNQYGYGNGMYRYQQPAEFDNNVGMSGSAPEDSQPPAPLMGTENGYYSSRTLPETEPDQPTIYQQDTAIGPDDSGALNVDHVTPPTPVIQAHPAPVKTVSSGVGPTYIPDGALDIYGGVYRVVPVKTRLFASYQWAIEGFSQSADEKLVSLPFGPPNWRWQLVIYPKGAGDGAGTHISAFIRPLRNELEIAAGEDWQRPIKEFTVRIRRAVPGSPTVGSADPSEDYLATDTSAESFTGFSAAMSGWGFPELLDLNSISEAVTYDGTLHVEAEVIGDQEFSWGVYQYQWDIPSFLQLTEDETLSQPFGPADSQWRLQIFRQGTKEGHGSHFSAYLIPEKSERELGLGSAWRRPIVSLTIKVQVNTNSEPLVTKTLTGGYAFDAENTTCGWAQLVELSQLNQSMDWYGTLSIHTEVTWDLSYGAIETDLGKLRNALAESVAELESMKGRLETLSRELDASRADNTNKRAELAAAHSDLSSIIAEVGGVRQQLEETEQRLEAVGNVEAKMAVVQKELEVAQRRVEESTRIEKKFRLCKEELEKARKDQAALESIRTRVSKIKWRLADVRAGMEYGADMPAELEDQLQDTAEVLKSELLQAKAKMYALESDLAEARGQISAEQRAAIDADINASTEETPLDILHKEDVSLSETLDATRSEILIARGLLLELADQHPTAPVERAGLSAQLAMVQAELEVARAAFMDALNKHAEELESNPEQAAEYDRVRDDLQNVRNEFIARRAELEDEMPAAPTADVPVEDISMSPVKQFSNPDMDAIAHPPPPPQSQPPHPHPPLPTQLHPTATDFGITRIASHDPPQPIPLPSGVPPPPSDIDTVSRPVAPPPPLTIQAHHLQETADAARGELDHVRRELNELRMRVGGIRELVADRDTISGQAVLEKLFGDGGAVECWTPIEGKGDFGGIDAQQLATRLKSLQPKRRFFPTFLTFLTALLTLWFFIYSTIYVACSQRHLQAHPSAPYYGVCTKTILPAWEAVHGIWHRGAERFVFDVAPGAVQVGKQVGSELGKGVRRGVTGVKSIVKEWNEPKVVDERIHKPIAEEDTGLPTLEEANPSTPHTVVESPAVVDVPNLTTEVGTTKEETTPGPTAEGVVEHEPATDNNDVPVSEPVVQTDVAAVTSVEEAIIKQVESVVAEDVQREAEPQAVEQTQHESEQPSAQPSSDSHPAETMSSSTPSSPPVSSPHFKPSSPSPTIDGSDDTNTSTPAPSPDTTPTSLSSPTEGTSLPPPTEPIPILEEEMPDTYIGEDTHISHEPISDHSVPVNEHQNESDRNNTTIDEPHQPMSENEDIPNSHIISEHEDMEQNPHSSNITPPLVKEGEGMTGDVIEGNETVEMEIGIGENKTVGEDGAAETVVHDEL